MPIINGLPSGNNKCIGSYSSEPTNKLYSFIWNSEGNHTINEYDTSTDTIFIILQGQFLQFDENTYINGCGLVGGNLLYWTDGLNPPRSIDITKAKTGIYYLDSDSICLAKKPPQELITALYADDDSSSTASNRLKGQLFQFRYLYVYDDGSRSAWSSCSEVPIPSLELQSDSEAYKNNNIVLTFDAGSKYVRTIEIAAQVKGVSKTTNTTDWFSILSVDRDVVISRSNDNYFYNPLNNSAIFKFYNDGLYQSVDILESDLPYDFVPLKSKTLDIINGNVLVLGNNTEGYDNIELQTAISVDYIDPDLDTNLPALGDKVTLFFNANVTQDIDSPLTYYQLTKDSTVFPAANLTIDAFNIIGLRFITDVNVPSENVIPAGIWKMKLFMSVNSLFREPILPNYTAVRANLFKYDGVNFTRIAPEVEIKLTTTAINSYDVEINVPETQLNTNDRIVVILFAFPLQFAQIVTVYTEGTRQSNIITTIPIQDYATISKNSYKTNSRYQLGLVYYDNFNRSSYVQTNPSMIVSTESWGETEGKIPKISWSINHQAPLWATKYQWVRTEQLTHKKFLYWISTNFNAPAGKDYYELTITSLQAYNTTNPSSILNYTYTPGDRCTVHKANGVYITGYDVGVVGLTQEAEADPLVLQIQKKSVLTPGAEGILIEIYTPKTRENTTTEQFFYEFGAQYNCSNGVHSITTDTFIEGDVYVKQRDIPAFPNTVLEDPNYSDFYVSNYSSNGRTNIFAPQAKQLTLPTDIRFSDVYVPNTNINGLSRFYGDAFETYDRVNGSIQKLAVRDNYLMAFQELKTGYIPINQSIIEDQGVGNSANVAISNKLLNKIRYFAGDYGVGTNPESIARYAGTFYFADPNRNEILRIRDGLQSVSKIGMDSYFTSKLAFTKNKINAKILGTYDPRNNEYIVSFRYPSPNQANNQTLAFNEDINRWTSFYSFIPDFGGYIFNQYITWQNGIMYTQNTNSIYNSFYGTTYSSTVDLVFNASPALIKSFLGLIQQTNTVWSGGVSTSQGQTSTLLSTDFSQKEGVWFASILRDTGSPGGILNGDDLKGNWIKFSLANGSTSQINLLSIDVRHIPSYQGIK
jgi:hypothetical protein